MVKRLCEICKRRTNKLWNYNSKKLCFSCYSLFRPKIGFYKSGKYKSLKEAISQDYEVKGYLKKNKKQTVLQAYLNVPAILIGHKIKIVLAD